MSFDKVQIKRKNTAGWVNIFGQSRSMSNGRLIGSALAWILGIAAIYCSMFYIPAFYDFKRAFGFSSYSAPEIKKDEQKLLSPYLTLLKQNRSYMLSGQAMEASYKLGSADRGKLVFFKCQSPVILEVFKCDPKVIKEFPVSTTTGKQAIQVGQNGFYGFAIALNNPETDYAVAWRRIF